MALVTLPYILNNLLPANNPNPLADIDDNFNAILAVLNGGIDQTNLSSSFNPIFSSLTVNGAANISGTLNAGGTTVSSLTVSGNTTLDGTLNITGSITQSGTAFITGGNATTGYNTNPVTGEIKQWTTISLISGIATWTFPLPFPNACVNVQGSICSNTPNANAVNIGTFSKNSVQVAVAMNDTSWVASGVYVMAIGY